MSFSDAEPMNAITTAPNTDLLPRRLGVRGTERCSLARLTITPTVAVVVSVSYYAAETGGPAIEVSKLNSGATLAPDEMRQFEFDLAQGQWINVQTDLAADVTGCLAIHTGR